MAYDLDDLFIDEEVSAEGIWLNFYGDSQLKLGSTESPKYKSALAKLARQNRVALDDGNPNSFNMIQSITAEALATHVLLDWKGIRMNGQDDIPYTPALGKDALLRSSKLRDFVTERAAEASLFRKEVTEKAGNSSPGTSSGAPTKKP